MIKNIFDTEAKKAEEKLKEILNNNSIVINKIESIKPYTIEELEQILEEEK